LTRVPPHDLAAEQAVLGAALLAPGVVGDLAVTLTPADFYQPAHTLLWQTPKLRPQD
jgi:Replicative DNA helicase